MGFEENVNEPYQLLTSTSRHPFGQSSWLTKLTYSWMTKLIAYGASVHLVEKDVWDLPPSETCATLNDRFRCILASSIASVSVPRFNSALIQCFKKDLGIAMVSFMLATAAAIAQPLLVQALLQLLQNQPLTPLKALDNGYLLMLLLVLAAFLQALSVNYGFFTSYKVGVNMRSVTMDMVYQKALRLSSSARQQTTSGKIVTLMSSDSERIAEMANEGVWIIASPLTFLSSLVMIGIFFGVFPALAGALATVIVLWISLLFARAIGTTRLAATTISEKRVKETNEVLGGIRVMKMYAWEDAITSRLQSLRNAETKQLKRLNNYRVLNVEFLFLSPLFVGAAVLSTFIALGNDIDVTLIYTLIAFANMSRHALYNFPRAIAGISEGFGAGQRLDAYLAMDEQHDTEDVIDQSSGIIAQQATWMWSPTSFALRDISFTILPGELVMVVGGVGSGKSSLISALAGELDLTQGRFSNHKDNIALVTQEPWIRNTTIRDNILFEDKLFDYEWYHTVVAACQLDHDLQLLPHGDLTEIGEQGVNLSGGQKARVHLARALFKQSTDILLLDDPLSAVDVHVAQRIFHQAIQTVAGAKTRILVLNSHYHFIPFADRILVLEGGKLVYNGSYNEEFSQSYPEYATKIATTSANTVHVINHVAEPTTAGAELIQEEDRNKGVVAAGTYLAYFSHSGRRGSIVALVLIVFFCLGQGFRIAADWFQGFWARNFDPSSIALHHGMFYVIVFLTTSFFFGRCQVLVAFTSKCSEMLHKDLLECLLRAPVNLFYDVTPIGRILNRFSRDLDIADSLLPNLILDLLETLFVVGGSLVVCAFSSFYIALTYLPIIAVFYFAGEYFKKSSRELKRLEGISRSPVFSSFAETLDGIRTIRAYQMQSNFIKLNRKAVDANAKVLFAIVGASRWLSLRMDVISIAMIAIITTILLQIKGISPTVAGLTLVYSLALISNVQWMIRLFDLTESAMTAVERLLHFKTIPAEAPNSLNTDPPPTSWPKTGSVVFDNLQLRYRPDLPLVLGGIDLSIAGGEKVGICGRTGAGKSSLMVALFRLAEFESGTIYIDGIDISKVGLTTLRRAISIIPQDPVLFSGTLRDNLDPFHEKSQDELVQVLSQIHLALDLNEAVAECGMNLSVGQRQLVCIGRALLRQSRIIVMDEATANVDLATDRLIQRTIQEAFHSKSTTVLTIAHRLHTILHCHRIVVLEKGIVVECDAPESLLATTTSQFHALAKQAGLI
ncbi:canalicular multispecific organic anion transporter [Thraustotheca clavata]|uniref:Canalicular multispecific organic anion transporter n=1 Tax=Thraustotheca clavata TaxID=74557 RepID=A0A1V9YY86_9STRA|nr:canalicular multispecific organic anion transporter [Thraustotheca clavata]